MADWTEIVVDELAIDASLVEAVARSVGKLTYYISGVGHEVNYANAGLATAAYQEWLAAHPPPPPPILEVGDWVRVLFGRTGIRYTKHIVGKIIRLDTVVDTPYWVLETVKGEILIVDKPGLLQKIDDPTI